MNGAIWIALAICLAVVGIYVLARPGSPAPATPESKPRERRKDPAKKDVVPKGSDPPDITVAKMTYEEDDDEITLLAPQPGASREEEHRGAHPSTTLVDEDADMEEPTSPSSLILIYAAGQTDKGRVRKKNEDSFLILSERNVFAVADGMGGYAGGDVASRLAVTTIADAFRTERFPGAAFPHLPRRASELVQSIEAANFAIFDHAATEPEFRGMGTTIVSTRFSPRKQRVYIGHVGDSRGYRLRNGELLQMTIDHTMAAAGAKGPHADRLMRALGVSKSVDVDLLVAKPKAGDVFLLCTDGLTKMLTHAEIREILLTTREPQQTVDRFVERANEAGGKDNITVIVIRVDPKK